MTKINFSISLLILFSSCRQTKPIDYNENDRVKIENAHVSKLTIIKIAYNDSTHLPKWERTERYKFFNEYGLCSLEVKPDYNYYKDPKQFLSVEETIDYTGHNDSTFYFYNNDFRLTQEIEKIIDINNGYATLQKETNYVYDNQGNLTSECFSLTTTEVKCLFSSYEYDNQDRIISRQDSVDYIIDDSSMLKKEVYIYDNNGNIVNDGHYKYKLDEKGNVLEAIPLTSSSFIGRRTKYDRNGNKIEEAETYADNKMELTESNVKTFFKYDSRGLITEEKNMIGRNIIFLLKYQYQ